jgi:hypothetical protein
VAFARPIPRPFNEPGIRCYAPVASGVYGISNAQKWIHVGEASNIQAALLACLSSRDPKLLQFGPSGFVFEECGHGTRVDRRLRLIAEYDPICERTQTKSKPGART